MKADRKACMRLLVSDLLDAGAANGPLPSRDLQAHWDDLLGFLAASHDLRRGIPEQARVLAVRNRLLAAGPDAIAGMDDAGQDANDYAFVLGVLVWLIRDCGLPYDPSLSIGTPTLVHLDAYRVLMQFQHLQRKGGAGMEIRH